MGPKLSVIVPVHNGAGFLDRCLMSLSRSEFGDFEVIVVDDGSTEDIRSVATKYCATYTRLDRRGGPARARNRGAAQAEGEILLFIDSDVCVHCDTLGLVDTHFRTNPGADAMIGSYDDVPTDPGLVSQYKNLFHHYVHQRSRAQAWTFWAGCGAIRRHTFIEMEGFDESYTRPCIEDIELGFRLRATGHRIDLNRTIQVTHLKRWTLWSLLRTDVRDRGVPWLLLMLRSRVMPPDLNVTFSHRLSVALVWFAAFLYLTFFFPAFRGFTIHPVAGALFTAALFVLLGVNGDLYRFFFDRRGAGFAVVAIALHWFYYGYCGLAVAVALMIYGVERLVAARQRSRVPWPGAMG